MLVTGAPGVGKTTLVERIQRHYMSKGLRLAGITTHEVRQGSARTGFRITDLSTRAEGWLARVEEGKGPRIGRYSVVSEDLDRIGVGALRQALEGSADLVVVDEIGPMEMTSRSFRDAVANLLSDNGIVIATVKYGSHYPEVETSSRIDGAVRMELSRDNREEAFQRIISVVDGWLGVRS